MKTPLQIVVGSVVFFAIAPGTVAGWIPYRLSGWRLGPPLVGMPGERAAGAALVVMGAAVLVDCFVQFARQGRGTPAPIAAPDTLVISGLYRHVRNPMYVAIVAALAGQALLFGSRLVVAYTIVVWSAFHSFVYLYEEPALRRRFGPDYDTYRAHVPRWWPRLTPWQGR